MFCFACVIVWIITFVWYFWNRIKNTVPTSDSTSTSVSTSTVVTPAIAPPMIATSGQDNTQKMITSFNNRTKWMYYDEDAKSRITIIFVVSPDGTKINLEIYLGDTKQPPGEDLQWKSNGTDTITMTKIGSDEKTYYFSLKYLDPTTIQATEFQVTANGPKTETNQLKLTP